MKSISFSIVIPNRNRADALAATLQSLAQQFVSPTKFEVVLVDDGSTDGSLEVVKRLIGELDLTLELIEQENQGPAVARNRGAAAANYERLLFLDSDILADSRLLSFHATYAKRHAEAVIAGAIRPWWPACTTRLAKAITRNRLNEPRRRQESFWQVFSGNLSISKKQFWNLGGFDESLWGYEDVDLAYRATKAGLDLVFAAGAVGYHNHQRTLGQTCEQERTYQRYAALFLAKHPELKEQITYLVDKAPIEIGQDSISLIAAKVARRLVATPVVIGLLKALLYQAERMAVPPVVLRFLYWKIVASYQLMGYREGLQIVSGDGEQFPS